MSISGINSVPSPLQALQSAKAEAQTPAANGPDFGERIKGAVDDLNEAQANARASATAFELGQENDLASVMVDQQVSSLSMQLTLQVRNKALSAYRDIMNMPV
ncbi:flagellar hook-basal body complex protein FliE [Marivivens niveibacter]|uniref:Flagellar hook-basal body complex protein FliE n=1 Tax=Marivivens niveibacter TaxID=1930667 RepID=A0A251X0V5_9RHOB|nr:flagellar hook-basal body complex protein FliE [Marivivens niveibacter]OUD10191.1 flagellar hook-basal body complex protein FliE [Marivivens niveibacter]